VPPYPLAFFEEVGRRLAPSGLARLMLADGDVDGRRTMLAGALLLRYGSAVYYAYSGLHRDASVLRPNDLNPVGGDVPRLPRRLQPL
jgi:hypothetical protein